VGAEARGSDRSGARAAVSVQVYRQMVSQMLAEAPEASRRDDDGNARPVHASSLAGPLVDWCKLSRDEQLAIREERAFERRLGAEVRKRHAEGWPEHRLIAFCERHRRAYGQ